MNTIFSVLVLAIFAASTTFAASESRPSCSINQARTEIDAFLKLKHKEDTVIRESGTGVGPYSNNLPAKWTFQFVAVSKDPDYTDCCGVIGSVEIVVRTDGSCAFPAYHASSATKIETRESYTSTDFLRESGRIPR